MSLAIDLKRPAGFPLRALAKDAGIAAILFAAFCLDHASGHTHGLYIGATAYFMILQDWRRAAYGFACFLASGLLYYDPPAMLPNVAPTAIAGMMAGLTTTIGLSLANADFRFRRLFDVVTALSAASAGAIVAAAVEDGTILVLASDTDLIAHASKTLIESLNGLFIVTLFLLTWLKPCARKNISSVILVAGLGILSCAAFYLRGLELLTAIGLFAALAIGATRLGVRAATLVSLVVSIALPLAAADLPLPFSSQALALAISVGCFFVGSSIAGQKTANIALDTFLKTQSDLVCSIDGNGRLVHAGTEFRRQILGAEDAAIDAVRFELLCDSPADAARFIERAQRGERAVETLKIQIGGERRAVRWTILASQRQPLLTLHGEDVTETIAAAERTELQQRSYRDIVETLQKALPCGTFHWPFGDENPTYSESWHAMLGYQNAGQSFTKESWRALVHPVDLKRVQEETEMAPLARVNYHDVFHRMLHANGTWRPVRSIGKVLKDDNGMPYAVVGIDFDITRLEDAVERASQADAALRGGFDVLSIGYAMFDEEGRLASYNDTLLHHHPALRNHAPLERRALDEITEALGSSADLIRKADGVRQTALSPIGATLVAVATKLPDGGTILIEAPSGEAIIGRTA